MELRFDFVKFYEKKNSIYCHIKTSNRALECKIVSKAISCLYLWCLLHKENHEGQDLNNLI